ncbi:hypothetical protein [Bacillus sonorensis]|uniref:hypothetical protein n=1 Tax=Bacillus sonorensis TaxID=119858 RepID=UPI00077C5482|nr:hypothetical protein [Bacillus sonorensis]MCF7618529.1 hypothetical protein [Bacillus sonorensis]MCY8034180.1 hypothetical protein [Bacillus sonorensis]MCY8272835.1 hypothetical protein [Bacillus sonorensis]MCY8564319.1 hypothetical protein [Bacillus sonorensis]MEC1437446.1 hypothetical protein [Bacillus sonorensis]
MRFRSDTIEYKGIISYKNPVLIGNDITANNKYCKIDIISCILLYNKATPAITNPIPYILSNEIRRMRSELNLKTKMEFVAIKIKITNNLVLTELTKFPEIIFEKRIIQKG